MSKSKVLDILNKWSFFYGQKGKPDCIRTTENVGERYQKRLCEKWEQDIFNGKPPKWTNREKPSFWEGE